MANSLASTRLDERSLAVRKCTGSLRESYRRNGKFKPLPLQNVRPMHVRDVYVECELADQENAFRSESRSNRTGPTEALFLRLGKGVPGKSIQVFDIFEPRQSGTHTLPVTTVVITGPPGCGKTFVTTRKLPLAWADDEFLPNAEMLFVIHARLVSDLQWVGDDACKTKVLTELLGLRKRALEDDEVIQVLKYLRVNSHSEKVVIIIDGKENYLLNQ